MTKTIEQLQAKIAELKAEVERLKAECKEFAGCAKDGTVIAAQQQMKLAALLDATQISEITLPEGE